MKTSVVFVLLLSFVLSIASVQAIGNCREDKVCAGDPSEAGEKCFCWSTCSPLQGGRKCDAASSMWSGYNRTRSGENDVGCGYYPGVSNARDLCVWYYEGTTDVTNLRGILE